MAPQKGLIQKDRRVNPRSSKRATDNHSSPLRIGGPAASSATAVTASRSTAKTATWSNRADRSIRSSSPTFAATPNSHGVDRPSRPAEHRAGTGAAARLRAPCGGTSGGRLSCRGRSGTPPLRRLPQLVRCLGRDRNVSRVRFRRNGPAAGPSRSGMNAPILSSGLQWLNAVGRCRRRSIRCISAAPPPDATR